jgi:hypothetical protein
LLSNVIVAELPEYTPCDGTTEAVPLTVGNTFTVVVVGEPTHVDEPSVYIKVYVNDTSIGALPELVNIPMCVPAPVVVVVVAGNVPLELDISPVPDKSVCVERDHK